MEPGESSEKEAAEPQQSKEPNVRPKLLNAAQAAFEIGVTKADIARLREEGKLAGVRGRWGRWYYTLDALSAVITNTPPPEPTPKPEGQSLAAIMNELMPPKDKEDPEYPVESAPLVRMANAILVQAIDSGASDIHLESDIRNVLIRCRIDGVLHEIMKIPNHIKGPLIQRYKVMADINVLEKRVPQAGTVWLKHSGKDYHLRVSTFPSRYGEHVTMHILTKSGFQAGFNKLGMPPFVHWGMEMCLQNYSSGLTLIVGPGGSGITTTAYAALFKLHSAAQKTLTLESLPEYPLEGIAQSYYAGRHSSSLSETLRLLPLMDVDTLFLGDINTPKALSGATEVAFSGKRVLATMAAEDTSMALWRLSKTGIFAEKERERAQVRAQFGHYSGYPEVLGLPLQQILRGVLAQRLVRLICDGCKESYTASADDLMKLGFDTANLSSELKLFRGKGCDACRNSGYKGSIGIYEFVPISEEIAALIALGAPLSDIKSAAAASGMQELRKDALAKILDGLTTPEEAIRVLGYPQKSLP